MPVHAEADAEIGDREEDWVGEFDGRQGTLSGPNVPPQRLLPLLLGGQEGRGVGLVCLAAADNQHPLGHVGERSDLHGKPEAVEELRAQLALLGIAAADQHEAGGMADRDTLPRHHVDTGGGYVEGQIDQMIVEQIDLIDIEKSAIGAPVAPARRP